MHNQYIGYNNIAVLEIFQHLHRIHGNITELELIENKQYIKIPWNQDKSIEIVFYKIENCIEFS